MNHDKTHLPCFGFLQLVRLVYKVLCTRSCVQKASEKWFHKPEVSRYSSWFLKCSYVYTNYPWWKHMFVTVWEQINIATELDCKVRCMVLLLGDLIRKKINYITTLLFSFFWHFVHANMSTAEFHYIKDKVDFSITFIISSIPLETI